ncbi:hypothetical protein E3N88_31989 [Mikania micrantha]|uniref:Uncharacterized protein n=1 Tax=Mikania micrantha TaxID=192012 RepID=A0A5N6M787_9ASTR|nr:hypothetical protein E3N88_31989 [Mikania micrantha]
MVAACVAPTAPAWRLGLAAYSGHPVISLMTVSFFILLGHDILMAIMLNGAAIMDEALLLIAANESCPQPQTSEHLAAVEIMRLANILHFFRIRMI